MGPLSQIIFLGSPVWAAVLVTWSPLRWRGLIYAFCLNLMVVALNAFYFTLPVGSDMGHGEGGALWDILIALMGVFGAIRELYVIIRHRAFFTSIPALILDLAPFPLAVAMIRLAMHLRSLQPPD